MRYQKIPNFRPKNDLKFLQVTAFKNLSLVAGLAELIHKISEMIFKAVINNLSVRECLLSS